MNFIHEPNRIYLTDDSNHSVAEVTFPDVRDHIVTINHTFVDGSLRGQGIAGKLMEEVVEQLRSSNKKARLSCSYAVKWFAEHEEASDVVFKSSDFDNL